MKKLICATLALTMLMALSGCGETIEVPAKDEITANIGIIFTTSGLGDNNFNDMAHSGLVRAEEELGINFDYAEPSSNGEIITLLRDFAQTGEYDLIFTLSSDSSSAMEEVSAEFPDQKFSIVDTVVEGDNIRSISKNAADQTFLTGVLAALLTQDESMERINADKIIGCIIGADIPVVAAAAAGFTAGAKYADQEVEVLHSIVGSWSDPAKAKEMATALFQQNADVILQGAGGSGMGVLTAASETQLGYVMGTGANQNALSPDDMVATATFELPTIIFNDIESLINGSWEAGTASLGLAGEAAGYTLEESNVVVSDEIIAQVEAALEWFLANDVVLPTDLTQVDAWVAEYLQ